MKINTEGKCEREQTTGVCRFISCATMVILLRGWMVLVILRVPLRNLQKKRKIKPCRKFPNFGMEASKIQQRMVGFCIVLYRLKTLVYSKSYSYMRTILGAVYTQFWQMLATGNYKTSI